MYKALISCSAADRKIRASRCKAGALRKGITMEFDYHSAKWRRKSASIMRRDGFMCVQCKRYGRCRPAVVVHHIKHVDEYPELAYTDSNLVSLCAACHNKAHPEKAQNLRRRY